MDRSTFGMDQGTGSAITLKCSQTTVFCQKINLFLPNCQSVAVVPCQNRFGTAFDYYRVKLRGLRGEKLEY